MQLIKHSCGIYIVCILVCILVIVTGIVIVCCDRQADSQDRAFCPADSVTSELPDSVLTSVNLPPNACITKIRASVTTSEAAPGFDFVSVTVFSIVEGVGQRIYVTDYPKDPDISVAAFETDFIYPLRIGPEGGFIFLTNKGSFRAYQELTVVYCPDCVE
ncbi:MAG: hypothetical protein GX549_01490 [Clostridiales bacterium]|nr:hypothetical protein [Clostridiales bacterium]